MQLSRERSSVIVLLVCLLIIFFVYYQYGTANRITYSLLKGLNNAQDVPSVGKLTGNRNGIQVKRVPFIPTDEKLKQMTLKDLLDLTHRYMDHIEILCLDQKRIGSVFDGGKHVCVDDYIKPSKPCLVYSFGSMNEFSFEKDAMKWFGCEVHTFDPFVASPRPPHGCTFHRIGLAGEVKETVIHNSKKQFSTLDNIRKDLNHAERIIDLLKIDIEASEWESLPQMVKNNFLGNTVKQMVIELHFRDKNETVVRNCLSALRGLSDAGFRVFSRERNTFCPACTKHSQLLNLDISFVTEFSFLNERFLP